MPASTKFNSMRQAGNDKPEASFNRGYFSRILVSTFIFSATINALMLAMPLYSLQVFSRAIPSGNYDTLIMLTLIVVIALTLSGVLEMVRSRLLEPGDMATPQRPVFALALTQPKWVRVYVSETQLAKVRPGMAASVVADGRPNQPIAGKVGYIASVAEFTPKSVQTEALRTSLVYEVRVVVQDPADVLRLGEPVTVRLATGAAK